MSGRLLDPGWEWLNDVFGGDIPDDLDSTDLTIEMIATGDEYLRQHGYTRDAFGAFLASNDSVEGNK